VTQAPNSCAVLKVNRQATKVDSRHASVSFDVETITLALAESDQTFLAKRIEAEAFGSVIEGLGGKDKEKLHSGASFSGLGFGYRL